MNASVQPERRRAAPSSFSMNSSALRRAASSTTAGWPLGGSPGDIGSTRRAAREAQRVTAGPAGRSPAARRRSPCSPSSRNERSTPPTREALRRPGGHAEDDLGHAPARRVALARRGDPEVLAHGGARARHRPEHDLALRAHDELLRHRLVVHGVVIGDGERLARGDRDGSVRASGGVRELEHRRRAGAPPAPRAAPRRPRGRERARATRRRVIGRYFVLSPFSAKYFSAPGWKGTGEPTLYWFASSRFFASE